MMGRRGGTVLAFLAIAAISLTSVFLYTERIAVVTDAPASYTVLYNEPPSLKPKTDGGKKLNALPEVLEVNKANDEASTTETGFEKNVGTIPQHDDMVHSLKECLVQAQVYLGLASAQSNRRFIRELRMRVTDAQRALGGATNDSELPWNARRKLKALEETLAKGQRLFDNNITKRLRAMVRLKEEQLKAHEKRTLFLTQVAAQTIPKSLNCLSLRLTVDYYLGNHSRREFLNKEKLEDTKLLHYAIFSDNVLGTAVVVNSTVVNAKDSSKHVFHIVTDRLNYAAFRMWFLANPPRKATIHVQSIEDFVWLNSSYSPVLKQLGSASMVNYYFRTRRARPDHNLKFRNPKYLSILNHLRFYLPQILPKLEKVLFLDDDVIVQKDLTDLWRLNLKGKINGAVQTCGENFHRFNRYLNFSNPIIANNFDPHACGWAFGMNIFNLTEWSKQNITDIYHHWQKLNHNRLLWKLGSLPPGLITFWNHTFFLDRSWHVLGLGYNPNVNQKEIKRAAVIHYNGNMKPWLEIGIPKYHGYWARFLDYDQPYLRDCNFNR